MKITLAQLNPTVGDLEGNLARATVYCNRARDEGTDLIVFPELFLVGYPPRDLLERPDFIARSNDTVNRLLRMSEGLGPMGIIIGAPIETGRDTGRGLYNSALFVSQGRVLGRADKSLLPTYDVFDEARYFDQARRTAPIEFNHRRFGLTVCEDVWSVQAGVNLYDVDPVAELAAAGADFMVDVSASPFNVGKERIRFGLARSHATRHQTPFVFVNQVGANDELIFDGRSLVVDAAGNLITLLPAFEECVRTIDIGRPGQAGEYPAQEEIETVYQALVLGVRDYVAKCGFKKVVVGLSGGIDSAVVCALAVAALGAENVMGANMPGPYSSKGSVDDSMALTRNLGVDLKSVPIKDAFEVYLATLAPHFEGLAPDETEENIQARIRGNILMALSNKFGALVLSTGNKSELAVGYCTLYGDMSGGLSVISDVPKTMVYELARYINRDGELIPDSAITKAPSAELRPDQTDQDTLPEYQVLDEILRCYVDDFLSADDIVAQGMDRSTVDWVVKAVNRNEYKRRQAPPGLKVTTKAFGVGRRMPIAAKYD